MKVKDVIKKLEAGGWIFVRNNGGHATFKKEGVRELITVSGHARDEVTPGQLADIRRTSGLKL